MSSQYVFTMHRLSRTHPPDKTVLNDVTLAFFPGAKIGVLGYNGAGKSTLLRIMAGVDQEYRGEAALAPGASVGLLEQEPQLDDSKDVLGNVQEGVAETKALLDRFNELAANYSEDTAEEFGRIQAQIEAADAWSLDTQLEYAMDALRLPPPGSPAGSAAGWRSAGCCCGRPTCCCWTSPPTTSTRSPWAGWSGIWRSTEARWSR
jgi:sulfate-transporting ATPase